MVSTCTLFSQLVAIFIAFPCSGKVLFENYVFKVDEVPSERIMLRLNPVNWMLVFGLDAQKTLYREWFRYMWKEIQQHGLKNTLATALEKLDAWEKIHLSR